MESTLDPQNELKKKSAKNKDKFTSIKVWNNMLLLAFIQTTILYYFLNIALICLNISQSYG